jgi:CcmD family protein
MLREPKEQGVVSMLSGSGMLLAANIVVWSGIAFYILGLGRRFQRLDRRVHQLEILREQSTEPK